MVAVLKSKELRLIFDRLEGEIKPEDLTWLRKTAPGFWEGYPNNIREEKTTYEAWKATFLASAVATSFLIQTVIDAKMRQYPREEKGKEKTREKFYGQFDHGMPKKYLMELAEILGIDGYQYAHTYYDCTPNAVALAKIIISHISTDANLP